MNFGKSKARFQMDAKTGIAFDDVAGIEEAKEEFEEVVTFLKTPERFTAVGAKIPKGVAIGGILREGVVMAVRGDTVIEAGDTVIIFVMRGKIAQVEKLLSVRLDFF